MTTAIATGSDGLSTDRPSTYDVDAQYEKILRLRDAIFADKHPTLKLLKQVPPVSKPSAPAPSLPAPTTNGPLQSADKVPAPIQNGVSRIHSSQSILSAPKSSVVQSVHNAAPGSSGLDPIFLKKSDVLVRAETQQKRQRIERALDEQLIQKRAHARQNILDEYALPDFNVTEVLRKAQEIVKPVKVTVQNAADHVASSSDSFDENTFYSSQMDSMSEGTDVPAKKRTEAEGKDADGPQAMDIDSGDAYEPASSRSQGHSDDPVVGKDPAPQAPVSQQAQIARLEEELRRLRGQEHIVDSRVTPHTTREEEIHDEPPYSPPDARASPPAQPGSNHVSPSYADQVQRQPLLRRSSKALEPQAREFLRRNEVAQSPVSNDMRIVRNHITSPLAPQPARVSPLAVAKEPPVSQARGNRQQNRNAGAGIEVIGTRQSPNQPVQPLSSRKRRRRTYSGEKARNVVARREAASPEARIKVEPISPQPHAAALGVWRPPRREEVQRPIVVDAASPRQAPVERIIQPSRRYERQGPVYGVDQGRPLTPTSYSNGRFVEVREDPDLRRIVSAKQVRAPMSPVEQYSNAQPYSMRATSQIYLRQPSQDPQQYRAASQMHLPQASQDPARPHRASIQPQPTSGYGNERSPSPLFRQVQRSPPRQESIAMAPPPRRIVVDQYGNRFVEAPAPERQMSVVPIARPSEYEHRYEQPSRATSVRHPSIDVSQGEPRYIARPPSPTSPRYVEYPPQAPPVRTRSIVYLDNDRHQQGYVPPRDDARMVNYIDYQTNARLEEPPRPREEMTRMSSVRPLGSQYELPRGQISRIPSVRPEQDRIISLSGRSDMIPHVNRQVSVRPEDMYIRPSVPAMEERPRYQYVPEIPQRQYATNGAYDDGLVFEAPRSAGRRIVQ